jgi:hypothetical protein
MDAKQPHEECEIKISEYFGRHCENLKLFTQQCHDVKQVKLEEAVPVIILLFLISETFGRSCSVFMVNLANYLDNPRIIFKLKLFQPADHGDKRFKYSPQYLLNFIVLREILRKKKILNPESPSNKEGLMRNSRKELIRYITDSLEDQNFFRGYVVIRYIQEHDKELLKAFEALLLKIIDSNGNKVFSKDDISPYFNQQVSENGVSNISNSIPDRDFRAEILLAYGLRAMGECSGKFEAVWKFATMKIR